MTFTAKEIKEVYVHEIIAIHAGNGGIIPLSKCDRSGTVFSKVRSLGHGFMLRDVVKLKKNPKAKEVAKENE